MFLTARILFLNEVDYIRYVLRSIYPAVDYIVVAEGCIEEYGKATGGITKRGLSTDGSPDEVLEFISDEDPDGKVTHIAVGWVKNYAELANEALGFFPRETTHFLNVDADEVYKPKDIQVVKDLFEEHPGLCGVAVDRFHFYLDFNTLRANKHAKPLEPTGGTMFRKFYTGEYYPDKAAEHNPYLDGRPLTDRWLPWKLSDGPLEMGETAAKAKGYDGITLRERMVPQYHYGWVREEDKMLERVIQTYRRADAYHPESAQWTHMSDTELVEYIYTYHPMWTGIPVAEDTLESFEGEHPAVMKTHPFYGKIKEDFRWL